VTCSVTFDIAFESWVQHRLGMDSVSPPFSNVSECSLADLVPQPYP